MNPTIARLTLRSLLGRKRVWLLLPMPVIAIGLAVLGHVNHPDATGWILPVARGLGFGVLVPILALIVGSSVIGSEIDDGTIVHILTKPLSRAEIVVAKLLVASIVSAVVSGLTMYVVGAIAIDSRFGLGLAVGAVAASFAYCALFVALSVVSRRPVLIGIAYILLWEGVLGNILLGTRSLSIEQYALTLASKVSGTDLLESTVTLHTSIIMCAVFVVAGAALAIDRMRAFTLAGDTS